MNQILKHIPVIDLFAGPGGLSEGFSSYTSSDIYPYKVAASVEMDYFAHKTLELRSFFHEFDKANIPEEYYQYLRQEITREELFDKYPKQAASAKKKAIKAVLGTDDDIFIHRQIGEELSNYKNKPWILIGGPPCQAYSLIGRSRRQANGAGKEIQQKDTRNFLYKEYLHIIAKFQPTIFVMENVKGILSAQVNGKKIIRRILADLSNPNRAVTDEENVYDDLKYNIYSLVASPENGKDLEPKDYLIQSEKYGIPQTRHRVILLGIRSDVNISPTTLQQIEKPVTVSDVLTDLPPLRSCFSKVAGTAEEWYEFVDLIKCQNWFSDYQPAIRNGRVIEPRKIKSTMVKALSNMKDGLSIGGEYVNTKSGCPKAYKDWYCDSRINGVVNHSARGHMKEDLWRYFFSSVYASIYGCSPRMKDFPKQLLPKHKNVQESIDTGVFDDRFRVQDAAHPGATITCHMAKDGHYSIHYDPSQCRSLTVREAARIQTFPDNYYFEGPRTEQYHQVGNAVPPLLALQIADVVYKIVGKIDDQKNK
jgi:DNA (cytosine-5)-methyltransferase 1